MYNFVAYITKLFDFKQIFQTTNAPSYQTFIDVLGEFPIYVVQNIYCFHNLRYIKYYKVTLNFNYKFVLKTPK